MLNDFDVDLSGFKLVSESIGKNCKEDVLILVETTVPPGTCEKKVVKPLMNNFCCVICQLKNIALVLLRKGDARSGILTQFVIFLGYMQA